MTRLFVVRSDSSAEHAMRFAMRRPSALNLFAVADGSANIRQAVREANPDVAVVYWPGEQEIMDQHVRAIRDEAPSAVILVLTEESQDSVLDMVDAAAAACASAATPEGAAIVAGAGAAPARHLNGNGNGHGHNGHNGHANGNGHNGHANGHTNGHTNGHALTGAASPRFARVETPAEPCPLTPRELEVLRAVSEGHANARIARDLWVTEQTVKFHLSNVYRKLEVSNRTEASHEAMVRGYI